MTITGPWRCGSGRAPLRAHADAAAEQISEALPGEPVHLLDEDGSAEWVRIATAHDGYVGWAARHTVHPGPAPGGADGHWLAVVALRTHALAAPDVRSPIVGELCLGARVWPRAAARGASAGSADSPWRPVLLAGGEPAWVDGRYVSAGWPLGEPPPGGPRERREQIIALAVRFVETPYVWGGRSAWGLDCSGLVQIVLGACGIPVPRDSDEQQAALEPTDRPEPGDLAFFPGHVGLLVGAGRMVHANARALRVTIDELAGDGYGGQLAASCLGYGKLP